MINSLPWSVAIFAARESIATLTECVRAVLIACNDKPAVIDVLVNGNQVLAEQASQLVNSNSIACGGNIVRVWFIPLGDKAHTWNEYVHKIWSVGNIVFFLDGYAEVKQDAFMLIDEGLRCSPEALGASGVPTSGRSANALREQLIKEGGIHGNLYAVRGTVMSILRQRNFRLPLGLYRTDPLLGAALAYRLDPSLHNWEIRRILVHPHATWHVREKSWWLPENINAQFKRKLRQAQGVLENRATREHLSVKKRSPESLPVTASQLVCEWIDNHPLQAKRLFLRQPLTMYAASKLRHPRDWSGANLPPMLMSTTFLTK